MSSASSWPVMAVRGLSPPGPGCLEGESEVRRRLEEGEREIVGSVSRLVRLRFGDEYWVGGGEGVRVMACGIRLKVKLLIE